MAAPRCRGPARDGPRRPISAAAQPRVTAVPGRHRLPPRGRAGVEGGAEAAGNGRAGNPAEFRAARDVSAQRRHRLLKGRHHPGRGPRSAVGAPQRPRVGRWAPVLPGSPRSPPGAPRQERAARWWFRKETLLAALLAGTLPREWATEGLVRAPAAPGRAWCLRWWLP